MRIRFPSARFPVVVEAVIASTANSSSASSASERTGRALGAIAIVVAGVLAYSRTFSAPFVFDDFGAVVGNASIRHLGALGDVLSPPHAGGVTVGGRPIVNLTLAVNHAISGEAVWSYHALNLLIHLGAALLLFGIVRRTLLRPMLPARFHSHSTAFAALVAALWALHPLQTESVTYIAQRAESLAGFFLLLTLYAFGRGRGWQAVAVIACALGMATKEVMAVAPVIVLLYDRTFVAGTFRAAWRERRGFYLSLAVTWVIVVALALGTAGRGGTAGFDTPVSVGSYLLTQCEAVVHYLRLAVWPQPLVFDYGVDVTREMGAVIFPAAVLLALLVATGVALVRWPLVGFLGAWFFVILAPSSSFVPVSSQPIAEHRMYLPLAAVIATLVIGGGVWLGRWNVWLWCVLAVSSGALTWRRNEVYRSELTLWRDTVAGRPTNARAHSNLGNALLAAGQPAEAVTHYTEALRLAPDYADAENNLGRALMQLGRTAEALPHFETALRAKPNAIEVLTNLGSALAKTGRTREAVAIYGRALQLAPDAVGPRYNLANALFQLGDVPSAAGQYAEVVKRRPEQVDARFNLAAALLRLNRIPEAITAYEDLLKIAPDDATAHAELANVFAHTGRPADAITHYETALRVKPDFAAARTELERLRAANGAAKP